MKIFTADPHLGGAAGRGFTREKLISRIINGFNQRAKPEDTLYIIGDAVSYGNVGYTIGSERIVTESLREKWAYYDAQINAKTIIIEGNHDYSNHVNPDFKLAFVDVGRYVALLSHYPTTAAKNPLFDRCEQIRWHRIVSAAAVAADFVIHGHVHDGQKVTIDNRTGLVNINVALDVRNFLPVKADEIISEFRQAIKQ